MLKIEKNKRLKSKLHKLDRETVKNTNAHDYFKFSNSNSKVSKPSFKSLTSRTDSLKSLIKMPYVTASSTSQTSIMAPDKKAVHAQSTSGIVVSTGRGFDRLNSLVSFMSSLDIQNSESSNSPNLIKSPHMPQLTRHVSQKPLINPAQTSIEHEIDPMIEEFDQNKLHEMLESQKLVERQNSIDRQQFLNREKLVDTEHHKSINRLKFDRQRTPETQKVVDRQKSSERHKLLSHQRSKDRHKLETLKSDSQQFGPQKSSVPQTPPDHEPDPDSRASNHSPARIKPPLVPTRVRQSPSRLKSHRNLENRTNSESLKNENHRHFDKSPNIRESSRIEKSKLPPLPPPPAVKHLEKIETGTSVENGIQPDPPEPNGDGVHHHHHHYAKISVFFKFRTEIRKFRKNVGC